MTHADGSLRGADLTRLTLGVDRREATSVSTVFIVRLPARNPTLKSDVQAGYMTSATCYREPRHPLHSPHAEAAVSRWVLVVDGGSGQSRSALAAVQALGAAGYLPAVTVSGPSSLAAASRYCLRRVAVPPVEDAGFESAIRREVASHPYLTVLASSDAALTALGAPVESLIDKTQLMQLAAEIGLAGPASQTFPTVEELLEAAPHQRYPLVVKPSLKTSNLQRPARRFDSAQQLTAIRSYQGPFIVQPYLPGEMRSIAGVMWQGRLIAAVHQNHLRLWPRDCGDACAAMTTAPDLLLESRITRLLAGYEGVFQAELIGPYLLDINPRVYGSLALGVAAGVNLVGIYCDLLRGEPHEPSRARPGVEYRWREGDARHLLSRWRAGEIRLTDAAATFRRRSSRTRANPTRANEIGPAVARGRYIVRTRLSA